MRKTIKYFEDGGAMPDPSMEQGMEQAPPQEEQGGDIQAQIQAGVQQFMETQDPEIAVQVVMMLAEAMGMGGQQEAAPPQDQGMGGQGMPPEGAPMGSNGMRIQGYANGGSIGSKKGLSAIEKYKIAKGL